MCAHMEIGFSFVCVLEGPVDTFAQWGLGDRIERDSHLFVESIRRNDPEEKGREAEVDTCLKFEFARLHFRRVDGERGEARIFASFLGAT